ncbi:hypothetical protein ACP70R_005352 [Stipagrostis hirtigluma subsp. patula]
MAEGSSLGIYLQIRLWQANLERLVTTSRPRLSVVSDSLRL